jgi:hypothetical protein
MMRTTSCILFITTLVFAGCSSAPKNSGPSPLDHFWQSKGKSFSAKKFVKPVKWAAGQYIVVGNTNEGVHNSVNKTTIIGKEGKGWVYEVITNDDKGKTTGMQVMVEGIEKASVNGDVSQIKVQWIKVLDEHGQIKKVDGQALMFYNMILKSSWEKMIVASTKFDNGGPVTVPAGSFAGTSSMKTSVKILFSTTTSTAWMHPDVPVNGMVKSETDDKKYVSELLDFGFNGKAVIK